MKNLEQNIAANSNSEVRRRDNLLSIQSVSKSFENCKPNSNIQLDVQKGTIHALVGENGAGKSTLMKIILGIYPADEGNLYFRNQLLQKHSPIQAAQLGIGMVHQHFMLADSLSVLQNILLFEPGLKMLQPTNQNKIEKKYEPVGQLLKINIPWHEKVKNLSVAMQQKVEILKVLAQDPELLIFDEPTAVLTPQESDELLNQFLDLKASGKTILFISHKLKEVKKVADKITVLKHGLTLGTYDASSLSLEGIADLMIGGSADTKASATTKTKKNIQIDSNRTPILEDSENTNSEDFNSPSLIEKKILLEFKNYSAVSGADRLDGFNCILYQGEILGVLGVEGNGQATLLATLTEMQKTESMALLPDDRIRNGLFNSWPAWKDLAISLMSVDFKFSFVSKLIWTEKSMELMKRHDVRPLNPDLILQKFSGGNQQKYVVGRDLLKNKKILIAPHPTRGVDIGAMVDIHNELTQLRNEEKSILLITSDLDEAFKLCDRVIVLFKGKNILELSRTNFNLEKIGKAMGGLF